MLGLHRLHCRRIRPLLWDYVGDRLGESGLEKVEAHLPACPSCCRERDALKRAQSLLFAARSETPPPPSTGWHELRARITGLGAESETSPTGGFASSRETSELEPVEVVAGFHRADERRAHRRIPRAASGWMPNLTLASAFAVFALTGAFAYRWFSNMPRPVSPVGTSALKEAANATQERTPVNVSPAPAVVVVPYPWLLNVANVTGGEGMSKAAPTFSRQAERRTDGSAARAPHPTLNPTLETVAYHPEAEKDVAPVTSLQVKPTKPHLHRVPNTGQSLARIDDGKFHPYKGPDDKLPLSDPDAHRFPLDRIVPVSAERQGALAVDTTQPATSDEDRAY